MIYVNEFAGQNWLVMPVSNASGLSAPRQRPRFLFIFSGVGHLNMFGGDGGFKRDTAHVKPYSSMQSALNHAIAESGIARPVNGKPALRALQWAPFASVSSSFNKNQSINSGFAVDLWRPAPFRTITTVDTQVDVSQIFDGLMVDVAVSDVDAVFYRIGYHVSVLGTVAFEREVN